MTMQRMQMTADLQPDIFCLVTGCSDVMAELVWATVSCSPDASWHALTDCHAADDADVIPSAAEDAETSFLACRHLPEQHPMDTEMSMQITSDVHQF